MSFLNPKMVMLLGCFVTSSCMAADDETYSVISAQQLHQLINERADIRAALTGLIPAFLHAKPNHHYY